jgi:hypothetical protein
MTPSGHQRSYLILSGLESVIKEFAVTPLQLQGARHNPVASQFTFLKTPLNGEFANNVFV